MGYEIKNLMIGIFCKQKGGFSKIQKSPKNSGIFGHFLLPSQSQAHKKCEYKFEHQLSSKMEKIVNNSGLQHLVEKVFWNLDDEDLKICAWINQSCKQILTYPIFCLSKFEDLSKKNHRDWLNVIQSFKNSDKGIAIIFYLKWNLKKNIVDPPCYCSPAVQYDFKKKI